MTNRTTLLIRHFSDQDYTLSDFHRCGYQVPPGKRVFVHVPKTGGSSVHKLLLGHPTSSQFMNASLSGCHRPVSRLHKPGETRYFTILRDPIERVWSYFNMIKHRWIRHPYLDYAKVSLEHFLQNCWEGRNQYVRYFSGFLLDEPGEEEYLVAIENLSLFEGVIDFNNFEVQLSDYCVMTGLSSKRLSIPHMNGSTYKPASDVEKELIATYNAWDNRLYLQWMNSARSQLQT